MPDWTYHPFFKHLLFNLPPEDARRLTLRILEIQASTAAGRRLFRVFGHGLPPKELRVEVFGLSFPGPTGLGPGIDTEGTSLSVMQHLGFGFIEVGAVGAHEVARNRKHDPLRLAAQWSLVTSPHAAGPSAAQVAARIKSAPDLSIPVGIALRGGHQEIAGALSATSDAASFFTLPYSCCGSPANFETLRSLTDKPLLLRIPPGLSFDQVDECLDSLAARGLDGCVSVAGVACPMLKDGELDGPFLASQSLQTVEHIASRFGEKLPVIGAGGVMSPNDALSLLDAGARLVELYAGLVFAGPGLPGRIVHALEHRLNHHDYLSENGSKLEAPVAFKQPCEPKSIADSTDTQILPGDQDRGSLLTWLRLHGWMLLAFNGWVLIIAGIFAMILAATVKMLPYDVHYLGMTADELCRFYNCHIVHFMSHDRVSFGGSIIAIGILYIWLASRPLRRKEAWAWWVFLISGMLGFGSFLTYLGYGYLDVTHAIATLMLLPFFLAGLIFTLPELRASRGISNILRPGATAWLWSPAGKGRALMMFTAIGMVLGGAIIMTVGMTHVFVPQDLEYMGVTVKDLQAINAKLISLIAHDRAGFGGGLCSTGAAILLSVWCGTRPGARGLWHAWLIAGVVGFAAAIGVHPIVGYTSLTHLLPAYIGAIAFTSGMAYLYKPMCRADESGDSFADH
jgi:dihydroorotate dehydrogenase